MSSAEQVDFLGVYSTREAIPKEPHRFRKRLWFIWKVRNNLQYFKQEINKAYQAVGETHFLSAADFEKYILEYKILANPVQKKAKPTEQAPKKLVQTTEQAQVAQARQAQKPAQQPVQKQTIEVQVKQAEPAKAAPKPAAPRPAEQAPVQVKVAASHPPKEPPKEPSKEPPKEAPKKIQPPKEVEENVEENKEEAKAKEESLAVKLEKDMRNSFGDEIKKMERARTRRQAFINIAQMIKMKRGIATEHKHMFTDFGIELRKIGENDLALRAFERAKELAPEDPNTYFNLSRINLEIKQYNKAWILANEALNLETDHDRAELMREHLRKIKDSQKLL